MKKNYTWTSDAWSISCFPIDPGIQHSILKIVGFFKDMLPYIRKGAFFAKVATTVRLHKKVAIKSSDYI